jgi:hypothetical protein
MSNVVYREDGTILLKNVTVSFPHVFEPFGVGNNRKKYSAKFLFPKETHAADAKALRAKIADMCVEKWKAPLPASQLCFTDGAATGIEADEAYYIFGASSKTPPKVIDRDKSDLHAEDADEKMYPGAVVNALVKLWVQDSTIDGQRVKRINADLLAVQRVGDGPRLVAARTAVDLGVFDDISSFDDALSDDGFN